jgi:hypothetical protein
MPRLEEIAEEINDYDDESKAMILSLQFVKKEIGQINEMKRTSGWSVFESKIREELRDRMNQLIKDDPKVSILLSLLTIADTTSQAKALDDEINKILPQSG